jgi:hypothetical protein
MIYYGWKRVKYKIGNGDNIAKDDIFELLIFRSRLYLLYHNSLIPTENGSRYKEIKLCKYYGGNIINSVGCLVKV